MFGFTYVHWVVLILILIIMGVFSFFMVKKAEKKLVLTMSVLMTIISCFICVIAMIIVTKYTKSAKLEHVKERILQARNTVIISGRVKNTGRFITNECFLNVRVSAGGFKLTGGNAFGSSGNDKPKVIKRTYRVSKKLMKHGSKNFTIMVRYPTYFEDAVPSYKLKCN